jgi:hypothetical protein
MSFTINGNVVPYGSGGHWYTQIVASDDGPKQGTSSAIRISYRIVFENSITDSVNQISGSDGAGSWSSDNFSFNGAGNYLIAQRDYEAPIQYGGGTYQHITFSATGLATGGTGPSSIAFDYYMPARAASPPDPPTVIAATNITATSASIIPITFGAANGAPINAMNYRVYRVYDGQWMTDLQAGVYEGVTYYNLGPGTAYDAYAQAHNDAGWGPWSARCPFTTLTGARVWTGSGWTQSPVYAGNPPGAPVLCEVRVYDGANWVSAG